MPPFGKQQKILNLLFDDIETNLPETARKKVQRALARFLMKVSRRLKLTTSAFVGYWCRNTALDECIAPVASIEDGRPRQIDGPDYLHMPTYEE